MKIKFPVLYIVMLVIMGILTGIAFCCSNMFPSNYYEYTTVEVDAIGIHAVLLVVLLLYFAVLRPRFLRNVNWNKAVKVLLPCSLLFTLAFSLFWALKCAYVPVWDPGYVCGSALEVVQGGGISSVNKAYLEQYPQQVGLVSFFALFIQLFGAGGESFMTLHILFAVCVPLILLCGYLLTDALFEDKEVNFYYLVSGMSCIVLVFYVNFVYSDIPGILLALLSLNAIVRYVKKKSLGWGIASCLLFIPAIVVRKHNVILAIAAVGMWILYAFVKKDRRRAIEAVVAAVIILGGSQLIYSVLGTVYGLNPENAEPSIAWVAMGLQRSGYGAGWYNGFVTNVYVDNGGNAELITQESIRQIKMSLMEFIREPLKGIRFYIDKLLIQWNQPSYQCLGLSKLYEEMPGGLVEAIYQGKLFTSTRIYFDCYQWVIYMGFTLHLWKNRKKHEIPVYAMIPILAILGGGLFSLLWEAKSRYILPYLVMMLPYAAKGWSDLRKSMN